MAWSSITAPITGAVISLTNFGLKVIADLNYLFAERPRTQIYREGVAHYTTTSTSFVAVDSTNLRITQTINSTIYRVEAWGTVQHSDTASGAGAELGGTIALDFILDGVTRKGSTNGILKVLQSNNGSVQHTFHISGIYTGVSVGSHTIDLVWRTSGATATMLNNAYPICMVGHEIG
jgi:hypothetical protein